MTSAPVPFAGFLDIVSFTASITIAVAVSASVTFATSGTFKGISLDGSQTDAEVQRTLRQVADSSTLFAWAVSLSALSLTISLTLRLLLTDEDLTALVRREGRNPFRTFVGIGSWAAIGLQGASLAVIGEAMKVISKGSGKMIQWSLLGAGLPPLLIFIIVLKRGGFRREEIPYM
ncbi:hypothetical protein FRC17_007989 [Serendipita sp. 399]|nr:hypothetical protein FRC17_007989 [Serendipita sp. 399]